MLKLAQDGAQVFAERLLPPILEEIQQCALDDHEQKYEKGHREDNAVEEVSRDQLQGPDGHVAGFVFEILGLSLNGFFYPGHLALEYQAGNTALLRRRIAAENMPVDAFHRKFILDALEAALGFIYQRPRDFLGDKSGPGNGKRKNEVKHSRADGQEEGGVFHEAVRPHPTWKYPAGKDDQKPEAECQRQEPVIDQVHGLQQQAGDQDDGPSGQSGFPGDVHVVVDRLHDIADLKAEADADFRALDDGQTGLDARQNQESGDRLVHGLLQIGLIGGGDVLHSEFVNRNIENAIERCKESQQKNKTLKSFEQLAQLHGYASFRIREIISSQFWALRRPAGKA